MQVLICLIDNLKKISKGGNKMDYVCLNFMDYRNIKEGNYICTIQYAISYKKVDNTTTIKFFALMEDCKTETYVEIPYTFGEKNSSYTTLELLKLLKEFYPALNDLSYQSRLFYDNDLRMELCNGLTNKKCILVVRQKRIKENKLFKEMRLYPIKKVKE